MGQTLQQIIQAMLDKVVHMVNTPGNPYYLPTWIVNNGYDPFGAKSGMSWSVTLTDPSVIEAAASVCPTVDIVKSVCKDQSIGAPGNNPTLVLGTGQPGGMLVSGGSNAYVASITADVNNPYNIVGYGSVGILTNPSLPKYLDVTGEFTFTQYCCCSTDGKTCIDTPTAVVGLGKFKARVNGSPQIQINFKITDLAPNVLTIGVSSMVFTPPMKPGTQTPDITVTVDITNIPKGTNPQSYNNMAETAFNSPAALVNVNQQINAVMNDPGQLKFIGEMLTGVIDGYLRDNNQYPFGPLTLSLH